MIAQAKQKTGEPKAYSYIRFSTPEQSKGDSERRQIDTAKRWAERRKIPFDENLTDRGFSAHKGHHRTKGALSRFLAAVEAGAVPSGSLLIVENIDRLGREGPAKTLRHIIFKLWDRNITLQTISPEDDYGPGCESEPKFIGLILYLQRAYDESKRKSDLGKANWKEKRRLAQENGVPLTARRHAWIQVYKDGKPLTDAEIKAGLARTGAGVVTFGLVPEIAEAVRLIFKWKLEGLGTRAIAAKLNLESGWKPSNGWVQSYVRKILTDSAVVGRYQPHRMVDGKRVPDGEPITNYYPAVIDPDLFRSVQKSMAVNRGKGGRTGKVSNLFTHLARCAYCGAPMHFDDKGGRSYLNCERGKRKAGCRPVPYRINYDSVESLILSNCRTLKPERVLPDPDEREKACSALRLAVTGRQQQLAEIDERIGNLVDQIASTKSASIRSRYETKIAELESSRSDVEQELAEATARLAEAETSTKAVQAWTRNLSALLRKLAEQNDPELRLRLRGHLRELIARIDVFAEGFPELASEGERAEPIPGVRSNGKRQKPKPTTKDPFAEYLSEVGAETGRDSDPRFGAFVKYVMGLRQSKAGAFVRVHFRTGATISLVPPGSIASGHLLDPEGGRSVVVPELDLLWRRFTKANPKRPGSRNRGETVTT